MSDDNPSPAAAQGPDQLQVHLEQLRAELEEQCRINLELRAELDDCRQTGAMALSLPAQAWQLPQLQLALAPRLEGSAHLSPAALALPPPDTTPGWLARLGLAWLQPGIGLADATAALQLDGEAARRDCGGGCNASTAVCVCAAPPPQLLRVRRRL